MAEWSNATVKSCIKLAPFARHMRISIDVMQGMDNIHGKSNTGHMADKDACCRVPIHCITQNNIKICVSNL
jgi:hypothetical protein